MTDHTGFILAAYCVTAVVLAGMVAAILMDYRAQRRQIDDLSRRLAGRGGRTGMAGEGNGDDEP